MTTVLVVLGLLAVISALLDLLWTTLAAGSGGGPITNRLAHGAWRAALAAHRRWPSHTGLSVAGVVIAGGLLLAWISAVYVGWTLVFSSAEGAVRSSSTGAPADLVSRIYFAGYTLFTLGLGDFRPGEGWWQMATVAATGSGLVLVTLSITYVVPVASAVSSRRQLSTLIWTLGRSPQEIVARAWGGQSFGSFSQHLVGLTTMLHAILQSHLTYPVLHYFHSRTPPSAAPVRIADLALAVDLLRHGVHPDVRPDPAALEPLDRTIDQFLETLGGAHVASTEEPFDPADLAPLRAAGIPTVTDAQYAAAMEATGERRRMLAGYVREDGRAIERVG